VSGADERQHGSVKEIIVLIVVVIFAGPTIAKRFSPQPVTKKRGVIYRSVRRFGPIKFWLLIR
jgi:hypothetical protein